MSDRPVALRRATSFSKREIVLLDTMLKAMMRGSTTPVLVRDRAFPGLASKITRMRAKLEGDDDDE